MNDQETLISIIMRGEKILNSLTQKIYYFHKTNLLDQCYASIDILFLEHE